MRLVRSIVMGMVMAGFWATAFGQSAGSEPAPQETYKGPIGTEDQPVRVSSGVMAGLLVHKVQPMYSPDLREVTGAVVMLAKVDPKGQVIELKVISGPAMLRSAAVEAVQQWTYKPYLLNRKPVFVTTTVAVNFSWR